MQITHAKQLIVGSVVLAAVAAGACGRADEPEPVVPEAVVDEAKGPEVTVTGCLTASLDGQSYALSPADSPALPSTPAVPRVATISYELVADAEELRRHANTVVTARGRTSLDASREVEVERESEPTPATPAPPTDGAMPAEEEAPTVETREELSVEARRLHVASVVATGETCPSLGDQERATGPTGGE